MQQAKDLVAAIAAVAAAAAAAMVWVLSLAWELPHATGVANKSVLFNFHMFMSFPDVLLLLIYSLIPLFFENIFYMIAFPWNLLYFVCYLSV